MKLSVTVILFVLIHYVLGSYKISQENLTVEYVVEKYVDVNGGCYKIGQNVALNMTIKLKIDLPDNYMVQTVGFKWLLDDYCVQVLQFQKPLKHILEMEMFDMHQSLMVHHSRPPVIWPLLKGTTYRIRGWIPDTTKFPPNLPGGKWKVHLTGAFANKTKVAIFNWFVDVQY